MTDQTPATEAGRRAEVTVPHFDTCAGMKGPNPCDCGVTRAIIAIEAEARADYMAEEAKRIETARKVARADALREAAERVREAAYGNGLVELADVLAILDPEAS